MIVNVFATVDIDNDGIALRNERNVLTWNGLQRLPEIKSMFERFRAPVTWFVRADNQLSDIYGSAAYLHSEHATLWRNFRNTGDEIAWHPHIYEWDGKLEAYVIDTDEDRCARKLRLTHSELMSLNFHFQSVRVGEAFHGNALMHVLTNLGLKIDSTAIPGRKREDKDRFFDWSSTPNSPYYPSVADYRVKGLINQRLAILEVPLTTMPIRTRSEAAPLKRYMNLTYHHELFRSGFSRYMDEAGVDGLFITTILHPEEISPVEQPHGLYSYSLDEARRNLQYMVESVERRSGCVRFLRMSDAIEAFDQVGDKSTHGI